MPRVLIVSPHFPPDTSAAAHRVRLLAPHLARHGWEPTVVAVDPRDYESRLDPGLSELVPKGLRVIRCRAWPARYTRLCGFGDLGLRALWGMRRTCAGLLRREKFDAIWITIFPSYPALMGPWVKRRYGVPLVLDYQDPWVGRWGLTVGGASNGQADWKSRLTRRLAMFLEPRVVRFADAITAVSEGTYEEIRRRNPALDKTRCVAIPLGGEAADFEHLQSHPRPNPYFHAGDGQFHLCYVGTLLPLGFETLRAVLKAIGALREKRRDLYLRLRIHFFGTSNQTRPDAPQRALPVARQLGVADRVTEVAPRIDYLDALTVLTQASAILLMGSSEPHYTASKLYPALLARRPLLAIYHEASTVVAALRRAIGPPTARLVTYNDADRAEARVDRIVADLAGLIEAPRYDAEDADLAAVSCFSAQALAGRLARVFEEVRASR